MKCGYFGEWALYGIKPVPTKPSVRLYWWPSVNIVKYKTVFFGRNISTQLERLEYMKDLGVIFNNELNFVQHCKVKINTAYLYLGIIKRKRNFIYLDEDAFVMLYKSLVRSHLEYANSVWNPHRLGLIKDL